MTPIEQAIEALDLAQRMIDWCRNLHPQQVGQADHEADAQIAAALAVLQSVEQQPVAKIVSSGPHDFPLLQWLSADHSFLAPIGALLYATPLTAPVGEPPKRLSEAEINHLVDTHVGGPTPSYPLGPEDWINFARAVEQATAARLGVKMGDV